MFEVFKKQEPLPIDEMQGGVVYKTIDPAKIEMRDIERTFARLFSTDDGMKVLSYLQVITFQRALGPTSPEEQLRYLEGQRSMIATILRLIDRGKNPT